MSNEYKVKVNQTFEFDISDDEISSLDAVSISENKFHLLQKNKSYTAEITSSNFNQKQYVIKVNNTIYEVSISSPLDNLINEMGFALASTKNVNTIKAPMPGLILDINVKVGQEVKEDETLLILEAMKMENVITSPRDGVIKSITAIKGNTVEKGTLLIEFES
ncbi:acetyl-CoA carboxylase biotin carboxyl carrier protein subunit [Aureibaculum sp. 2210JD6-5]|uniref:acetyl-CoA carboxylase biotin carboxyl carrier protein subunit n=1 Tax=Aureibaculum sp. 2210JD6-5 TaxID=3103957 RepID=UPI002AAEBCEB|nr:acetyl-CoA carboxylase biotin carboxyl carrier protein subunit [Aureibaculum sp. 2210JD6-5]MDY7395303.1 acetyl-CoA carboxylase biotin carboxyl carrier protein subunit [Aureibaculum sp. 2210JD6-5]